MKVLQDHRRAHLMVANLDSQLGLLRCWTRILASLPPSQSVRTFFSIPSFTLLSSSAPDSVLLTRHSLSSYPVLNATDMKTSRILLVVVVALHAGFALAIKILFFA